MSKLSADQIFEEIQKMNVSQANYQAVVTCWIASHGTASKDSIVEELVNSGKNKANEKKDASYHKNGNPVFKVLRSKFIITETEKGSKVFKINADLSSDDVDQIRDLCHKKLN